MDLDGWTDRWNGCTDTKIPKLYSSDVVRNNYPAYRVRTCQLVLETLDTVMLIPLLTPMPTESTPKTI